MMICRGQLRKLQAPQARSGSITPAGAGHHHSLRPTLTAASSQLPSITRTKRSRQQLLPVPEAASGGGSIAGGGKYTGGGGSSGSGGTRNNADDNSEDAPRKGGLFSWKGWQDRVAYDPEFPFKVFLEQVIGVAATALGDMSSRPNWGLNELDFVFSTVVVGSIINFSIMYLLAPTAATAVAGAAGGTLISRLMGDHYLRAWGAPGGNMFQPGAYSPGKRVLNFAYKGCLFASIGMFAGLVGTAISNGLLIARKALDPSFVTQNTPPDVLANASTWAMHMALSTNIRYQLLGGTDQVLVKLMPSTAFRVYSTVIRTGNNIVGGISFATLAKILGVQKSHQPDMEALPA